ncbi:MAG: MFS transporter, partial [Verrucomicrobiota bacterium]
TTSKTTATPSSPDPEVSKKTFQLDLLRCGCSGLLGEGWRAFGILIAIEYFGAGSFAKGSVSAAFMIGLLLAPVSIFYLSRLKFKSATLTGILYFIASGLLLLSSFSSHSLALFLIPGVMAAALLAQQMPLLIHIYSTNYASNKRGKNVSFGITLGVIGALPFGFFGGKLLDLDLGYFVWLFRFMSMASLMAGIFTIMMPSERLAPTEGGNPLKHLNLIWKDKIFGCMLGMWMILGFGNLATMPLQTEYMVEDQYGILATASQVSLCLLIIPNIVRMCTTYFWGYLFDQFDFFLIRALASIVQLSGIIVFFFSPNLTYLYIAGGLFGLGLAGANVNWSLWVTKFAPTGEESNYMSVHSFLTGTRGIVAPYFGFFMVDLIGLTPTVIFGTTLVTISILLIYPISRMTRTSAVRA